jgi:hypothetical protein
MMDESKILETWSAYHRNHPTVLANWAEQNGYEPNCPCAKCDPHQKLPRPDILVEKTEDE